MASCKLMETKDGKRFYQIAVSRGYGKTPYTLRWYVPDGWSQKTIERELRKQAAAFELKCKNGEVLNREQEKQIEAEQAAELAKVKTFRQYADTVFLPTKEATISENTRRIYGQILEQHIYAAIGDFRLTEITPAMIKKMLLDFQKKGYAHASVIKMYQVTNGVLEMAFLDDSIPINPMLKVKRPAPRKGEKIVEECEKALTGDQLRHVLACVQNESLQWQTYITLAADTGARRGELCGLHWTDIDFAHKIITIRHNLQYTSPETGIYETTPKNGKTRIIDIGDRTVALLQQLRDQQKNTCISKYVFSQEGTPEPMNPQTPTRYFSRFGKKYGIPNFHPHLLRHTSASIAITNGADVVSVSARLGHSDTAITLRMYAHANEESIKRAGQIVRDIMAKQA